MMLHLEPTETRGPLARGTYVFWRSARHGLSVGKITRVHPHYYQIRRAGVPNRTVLVKHVNCSRSTWEPRLEDVC